jgi:hypothetical protein
MVATPPIVANTDFQQWQSWQKVQEPGGGRTYYVIPGYDNRYVFDPYGSDATGRITIYENPQGTYDAVEEAKKQEEDANSLGAQLAVPAGAIAGTAIVDGVSDLGIGTSIKKGLGSIFADAATSNAVNPAIQTPNIVGASRVPSLATAAPSQTGGGFGISGAVAPLAVGAIGAYTAKSALDSFEAGKGQSVGDAFKNDISDGSLLNYVPVLGQAKWLGSILGSVFGGDRTKIEGKKLKGLANNLLEQGLDPSLYIPGYNASDDDLGFKDEARSHAEQLRDSVKSTGLDESFQGFTSDGRFVNNRFLSSGDEKDLTGIDIQGYADTVQALLESGALTDGMTQEEIDRARFDLADRAIAAGAVKQSKGSIEIDRDKLFSFNDENFKPTSYEQILQFGGGGESPTPLQASSGFQLATQDIAKPDTGNQYQAENLQSTGLVGLSPDQLSEEAKATLLAQLLDGDEQLGAGVPLDILGRPVR